MDLKTQFKVSWTFVAAAVIFIILIILSKSGLYYISDSFSGLAKVLLAVTLTYSCIMVDKRMHAAGKRNSGLLMIYGAGFLSGIWLFETINLLF
jgi:ABC-type siderophore export system fused ATPase/permease subunit